MPRLSDEEILKRATSIMGKRGGRSRSEKKVAAVTENIKKANAALTGETPEETRQIRREKQLQRNPEEMSATNRKAVAARWGEREAGMSNEEFRELCAEFTAQEIADAIDVPYNRVITWRRKVKPVLITVEDAKKIRKMVEKAQRARTGKRADQTAK